jgi:hypothetical protein
MQLASAEVRAMPTRRQQSPAVGACGRRMPCAAAALVPATPILWPGTRRGPAAARPPPVSELHPVSTSTPLEGHNRK